MSLMGTLAKVAIGYAAARGVDHLSGGKGLGGLMGGAQVPGDNPMSQLQAQFGQMMGGAGGDNPLAGIMEKMQSGGLDLSFLFIKDFYGLHPLLAFCLSESLKLLYLNFYINRLLVQATVHRPDNQPGHIIRMVKSHIL